MGKKTVDLDSAANYMSSELRNRVVGKHKFGRFLADYLKVEFDDVYNAFGFFEHETDFVLTIDKRPH